MQARAYSIQLGAMQVGAFVVAALLGLSASAQTCVYSKTTLYDITPCGRNITGNDPRAKYIGLNLGDTLYMNKGKGMQMEVALFADTTNKRCPAQVWVAFKKCY